MRNLILAVLVFAVLACSATTVFAQEPALKMDDVGIQPGETAFLCVSLNGEVSGDIVGISYSYDHTVLKVITEACTWARKGVLSDFDPANDRGVWTSGKSETFSGEICVLAFQVRSGVEFSEATVQCTLLIKSSTETVGEYTAEAVIRYICEHSFGEWSSEGTSGHSRTCESCGITSYEPHIWGGETYSEDPDNPGYVLKTRTCGICSEVLTESTYIETSVLPTTPATTEPEHTQPTYATNPNRQEETEPEHSGDKPQSTMPTEEPTEEPTENNQSNQPGNSGRYESASDKSKETEPSDQSQKEYNDHREENLSNQDQNTQDDDDHEENTGNDHVHEETQQDGHDHSHDSGIPAESIIEPGRDYHIHINENGEHVIHYDDPEGTGSGSGTDNSDNYHVHVDENGEYIIHYAEEGEACEALLHGESDHDHTHEEDPVSGVTVAVVAAAFVAMIGGAYWYLKKKR